MNGHSKITLWLPPGYSVHERPEISVVVPALNEELTVGKFVEWCKEGLKSAAVVGQIMIVDSSTDRTADIALAHGVEVLKVPRRGLGRAYIDSIPYIRAPYVLMGDADLTYDFRNIELFLDKFREGYEVIMGSRFKGTIAKGAMPSLHRYFGNPCTTAMFNVIHGSRFSDIHCGMRGVTRDGLIRLHLQSQSWEYASEMIIKAIHLQLKMCEVPVNFYKDRDGRVSNLKRLGWFAPWHAGWITVRAMFTYGADFFLVRPGQLLSVVGFLGVLALYRGPVSVGGVGLSLHWMLLFLLFFLVGLQLSLMGLFARVLYDVERKRAKRWFRYFQFNRSVFWSAILAGAGLLSMGPLVREYVEHGFRLPQELSAASYHAVAGIGLLFSSVIYFTFSLVFNAALGARPEQLPSRTPTRD